MDVVSLKLTSGEEVVGMLAERTDRYIKLRKPLQMAMSPNGPALMPYFASGDVMTDASEVEFNTNTVVALIKTYKPFADAYTKATTGLDLTSPLSNLKL